MCYEGYFCVEKEGGVGVRITRGEGLEGKGQVRPLIQMH